MYPMHKATVKAIKKRLAKKQTRFDIGKNTYIVKLNEFNGQMYLWKEGEYYFPVGVVKEGGEFIEYGKRGYIF